VRGPQLLAGVRPPTFAAQPFAVEELCAGELDAYLGAAESLDRLAVQRFRGGTIAVQRTLARVDPERPVRAAGARHRGELLHGRRRRPGLCAARPSLHELGERPLGWPELTRVRARFAGRRRGLPVPAEAVAQDGACPERHVDPDAFAPGDDVVETALDQRFGLLLVPPYGGQTHLAVGRQRAPRRLRDGPRLLHQGCRDSQVTGEELDDRTGVEGQGQGAERSRPPNGLQMPNGEDVPAAVVPQ
jgi:hypothetical protein